MALFGGKNKTEASPQSTVEFQKMKYDVGVDIYQYQKNLERSMKALMNAPGKTDDKIRNASPIVLMKQNEVIIRYLDDILKKLEGSDE